MLPVKKSILRCMTFWCPKAVCLFLLILFPTSTWSGAGQSQAASHYHPATPNSPDTGDFNVELVSHLPNDISIVVAVSGKYAYISDQVGTKLGLRILDISNPAAPVEVSFLDTRWSIQGIAIAGSYAYLTDYAFGLRIVNVSNPAHPLHVGSLSTPNIPEGIAYSNGYVFIADWEGGLRIIDVSKPSAPKEVSSYSLPGITGLAKGVAVSGNHAYVTWTDVENHDGGIWVFDVSDPVHPLLRGTYSTPDYGGDVVDVALEDHYAYLADSFTGLRVVDISDPAHPTEVGFLITNGMSKGVAVLDKKAYLVDQETGYLRGDLHVVDVSTPANPQQVGFLNLTGWGTGIDVNTGNIFVAKGNAGFYILRYAPHYVISGRISYPNGLPVSGLTVSISSTLTATTGINGIYAFTALQAGAVMLTPAVTTGRIFQPATRSISLPPSAYGQDFVALPTPILGNLQPDSPLSLSYADSQALQTTLAFPSGSVSQPVTVTITPTMAARQIGYAFTGHAFDLGVSQTAASPPGFAFSAPVGVTIHYSDWDVRTVHDETQLTLKWWDGNAWVDAASTCNPASTYTRDVQANTLSVSICQTGKYALVGQTNARYLPLVLVQ